MTFLHASFLWWLLLGSIPIIIYYLMRFRSLKVTWGANYILERALERLKKKLLPEQILLLITRTVACLLFALAFAQPTTEKASEKISNSGIHRILVVDNSYSMLAEVSGKNNVWEQSQNTLKSLISTWGRGEVWSLYVLGENPRWLVERQSITDSESAAAIIESIKIEESDSSLAKAFEVLGKLSPEKMEVYLFSDDQSNTWRGVQQTAFYKKEDIKFFWISPNLENRRNVAVTRVQVSNERAVIDHPVRVFAHLKNFSENAQSEIDVQLLIDGTFYDRRTISLLPGQESPIHFDAVFEKPGAHYLTVRCAKDALSFDNQMSAGIDILPQINALVIKKPKIKKKFSSSFGFLNIINKLPRFKDEDDRQIFSKGILKLSESPNPSADVLAEQHVVIVDGATPLSTALADKLKAYSENGGGIFFCPDESIDIKQWNDILGSLLPAKLDALQVRAIGGKEFRTLLPTSFKGLGLKAFSTRDDGDIGQAKFFSWLEFSEITSGSETLVTFDNEQPFILKKRQKSGCTILMASGLSGRGNNLTVRETAIPLVFRLMVESSLGAIFPRTVDRNAEIHMRVSKPEEVKGILYQNGDQSIALKPKKRDGIWMASLDNGSPLSGLGSILTLRPNENVKTYYGIQGKRSDSDLTALDASTINAEKIKRVGGWEELKELIMSQNAGTSLFSWFILVLLICLITEMFLQKRFL